MPLRADVGGADVASVLQVLGVTSVAPPAPTAASSVVSAPQLTPTAPVVSQTPRAGQGIATDTTGALPTSVPAQVIPVVSADPTAPVVGQIWYRDDTSALCVRHSASTTKRVTLA